MENTQVLPYSRGVTSLCVQQNHSSAKSPAWANCTKCLFEGRARLRVGGRERAVSIIWSL